MMSWMSVKQLGLPVIAMRLTSDGLGWRGLDGLGKGEGRNPEDGKERELHIDNECGVYKR